MAATGSILLPAGPGFSQLGAGRVKILPLAFQVTTEPLSKRKLLFVFTSTPPATGQLLSRLITQPRAWLDPAKEDVGITPVPASN